jgi:large subunit ribosomal protein L5
MTADTKTEKAPEPRLKKTYQQAVVPELMKRLELKNPMEAPRLKKIVVNMGVSEARENAKAIDTAGEELAAITGQRAEVRRAKKSISNFKLREGMPIGLRVTLRSARMWEFFDRLVNVAMPRLRDFQGLNPNNGFDGRGNYNLGLSDHFIFPEINLEKSEKARGMNITIVTSAKDDKAAREFLTLMGLPLKKGDAAKQPAAAPAGK